MKPWILSLCDKTGNMVRPWSDAGYPCMCVDTQHSIRKDRTVDGITYVWGDVRSWIPPEPIRGRIGMLFAFPPCTDVCVSGARDFRKKGNILLRDALELFSACESAAGWSGTPYMIENPIGKFSDHMGKPDYTFQPWQYGAKYTKKTSLWTGNNFQMPIPTHTQQPDDVQPLIWRMAPSDERANMRSATPPEFAVAVYDHNHRMLEE